MILTGPSSIVQGNVKDKLERGKRGEGVDGVLMSEMCEVVVCGETEAARSRSVNPKLGASYRFPDPGRYFRNNPTPIKRSSVGSFRSILYLSTDIYRDGSLNYPPPRAATTFVFHISSTTSMWLRMLRASRTDFGERGWEGEAGWSGESLRAYLPRTTTRSSRGFR